MKLLQCCVLCCSLILSGAISSNSQGDQDIDSILSDYAAAYSSASATAETASTDATESTTADWMTADPGLPTAEESYSSILDASPTIDDGTAAHSQKKVAAAAPTETIDKSSVAKETASINAAASHIEKGQKAHGELGESQGVDDDLETSEEAAIDEGDDDGVNEVDDAPEQTSAASTGAWIKNLRTLEHQVDQNPEEYVTLSELNSYYLSGHLSNKQLQKLSKWMTKNTMPMRGAETRDLGESQHDTSDSVGSQAYRIADLHYAVLSIFG